MLVAALIISAELIVLFRLALPDFLAWAEARHDAVYNVSDGDWPHVPSFDPPNHDGGM